MPAVSEGSLVTSILVFMLAMSGPNQLVSSVTPGMDPGAHGSRMTLGTHAGRASRLMTIGTISQNAMCLRSVFLLRDTITPDELAFANQSCCAIILGTS